MELHNTHSVRRRTGKKSAQLCPLLPVHWAVKYNSGGHRPPGTTKEIPRTEECICKGKRKYATDLREMVIIRMFIQGKINYYVGNK